MGGRLTQVRSPSEMIDHGRRRLAAQRTSLAQRRAAWQSALRRGTWSNRLSAAAFAGTAMLGLLPALDAVPDDTPAARAGAGDTGAGDTSATAGRLARERDGSVRGQVSREKVQGSLTASLLDSPSPPRVQNQQPVPPTPPSTWQIVPTRRMDLAGHVVDSADPIASKRKREAGDKAGDGSRKTDGAATSSDKARDTSADAKAPLELAASSRDEAAKPAPAKDAPVKDAPAKSAAPKSAPAAKDDKPLPVPASSAPTEAQADAWTDAEVAEARAECARLITGLTLDGDEAAPVRNGACGTPAPITLKRAGGAMTELSPPVLVNCRFAVKLNDWINDTLQPAAQAAFGQPVVRILTASSYTCRNRYGQAQGPISEHAFANALDMSGFVLRDGRVVKVIEGWGATARDAAAAEAAKKTAPGGAEPDAAAAKSTSVKAEPGGAGKPEAKSGKTEANKMRKARSGAAQAAQADADTGKSRGSVGKDAGFLRKLHSGACGPFGTVLGPEANEAHRDHIHVDLKQRKHAAICE